MDEAIAFHVHDSFPAAHRIRIDTRGTLEPVHVHHWRVDVLVSAPPPVEPRAQDALAAVRAWTERYRGRSLNDVAPFDVVNPTAEEVARVLYGELCRSLPDVEVHRVTIGEAAGFSATYEADGDPPRRAAGPAPA